VGRKPSSEDAKIFAAMDSDATIDSDGNEKEDSQGKKKEKKRAHLDKLVGRLGNVAQARRLAPP
jgi:hypothetical protein